MQSVVLTDFGKEIKKSLIDIGRTQAWLIKEVSDKTGLYFDRSYMHKILTGALTTPKIVDAICEILNISGENQNAS